MVLDKPAEAQSGPVTHFKGTGRQERKQDPKDRLPEFGNMLALAEREGVVSVDGTVAKRLEFRLDVSGMKDAERKALYGTKRDRFAQASKDDKPMRVLPKKNAHVKEDKNRDKFVRMPKEQLQEKLFNLFNQRPNWRFDELRKTTQQPTEHLKEVLSEIADHVTKGNMRHTYQLNASYSGEAADEGGDGPSSAVVQLEEDEV